MFVNKAMAGSDGSMGWAAVSASMMSSRALLLFLAGAFEDDGECGVSGYVPASHCLQGLQSDQVAVAIL